MDSGSQAFGIKYFLFSQNICCSLVHVRLVMRLLCQICNECHVVFPSSLNITSLIRLSMAALFEILSSGETVPADLREG
jgi:hypothetical protein